MKDYCINRKLYKEIRRMDHNELSEYLKKICNKAYDTGYSTAYNNAAKAFNQPQINEQDIYNTVKNIKGIGEKKASAIVQALKSVSDKENKSVENS